MKKHFAFIILFLVVQCFGQEAARSLDKAREQLYTSPKAAMKTAQAVFKKTSDDQTKISALITIINAEMLLGKAKSAVDHCNEAIALSQKTKNVYQEITVLSMLGNQYQVMMMTENAKKCLDKAENMMNAVKMPDSLQFMKGNLYNIKGIVFRDELNCEFALKYFDKALDVYRQQKNDRFSVTNQALINIQKASCLLSDGNIDAAEKIFKEVDRADFDLGFNRFYVKICLSEIEIKRGKYEEALALLSEIPIREIEQTDPELSSQYYRSFFNFYSATHDRKQEFVYLKKYEESLQKLDEKRSKIIDRFVYESSIENQKELENERIINLIIYVFLTVCVLISAFIVIRRMKMV